MQDPIKEKLKPVNYGGIAGVALILVGAALFGVYPLVRRGAASERATRELKTTMAGFNGLADTLARGAEALKEPESRLSAVENRLPGALDASKLNADLTAAARSAGVRVESMPKPDSFKDAGDYKALPMTIVGTGDWQSCEKFLLALRGMDRMVRLDEVTLDPLNKDEKSSLTDNPACRIMVKFSTFFMER
jgi:Tfp pilus assembly protein PilO